MIVAVRGFRKCPLVINKQTTNKKTTKNNSEKKQMSETVSARGL